MKEAAPRRGKEPRKGISGIPQRRAEQLAQRREIADEPDLPPLVLDFRSEKPEDSPLRDLAYALAGEAEPRLVVQEFQPDDDEVLGRIKRYAGGALENLIIAGAVHPSCRTAAAVRPRPALPLRLRLAPPASRLKPRHAGSGAAQRNPSWPGHRAGPKSRAVRKSFVLTGLLASQYHLK
jgi:hypothetical protein